MSKAIQPWEFLLITSSGWVNRHQQRVIDHLIEENHILKGKFCGKRIRFTDNERRRLAVKGKKSFLPRADWRNAQILIPRGGIDSDEFLDRTGTARFGP